MEIIHIPPRFCKPAEPSTPMPARQDSSAVSASSGLSASGSRREPVHMLEYRDANMADELAHLLAQLDCEYMDEPFTDLAGLKPARASWYRSLAAYSIRACRRQWRTYAHQRALDAACRIVSEYLADCFLRPSPHDPTIWIRMSQPEIRARVSVLITAALTTNRAVLNGDEPLNPGTLERLHEAERQR